MTETQRHEALSAYSRGEMTAIELRRRLDGATYGEVLRLLSESNLTLPKAPQTGREYDIQRAHAWMFPRSGALGA